MKIKDLLKANPWLSAVILGTHFGILNYKEFEGMEYDLKTKPHGQVDGLKGFILKQQSNA